MRKAFLTCVLALCGFLASGQTTKVVTDSVVFMPDKVQIFEGLTSEGKPKWWIELPTSDGVRKIRLTESHVTSGRLLALIERRDSETGKYSYSVKFAEPKKKAVTDGKADLSKLR